MMTRSSEAILQARSIREHLTKLTTQATGTTSDAVKGLDRKIATLLEGSGESTAASAAEKNLKDVNANVYTLYTAADRADAAPTPAIEKAASETEADLAPLLKRWQEIISSDIAALNRRLAGAHLTEIQTGVDPQLEEEASEDLE
jgi:hypothetical protein